MKSNKHRSNFTKEKHEGILKSLDKVFGRRCWYCGQFLVRGGGEAGYIIKCSNQVHIDHIFPKSSGGTDHIDNLALSCSACNRAKSGMLVSDFLIWLARIRSSSFNCFILGKLSKDIVDRIESDSWDRLQKDFF